MNFDKKIGRDLQILRRLKRVSRREIARVLDINADEVAMIEQGKQKLEPEQFFKIRQWIKNQPNMFLDAVP